MTNAYGDHPPMDLGPGWIAVALGRDVEPGVAVPAIVGGREIVLWRTESGVLQAWVDRCPHRGMRLSLGFVRGESLSCLYHGWRYGADGGCIGIPAHPDLVPPRTITATTYPVIEAAGLIWLALGDAAGTPPAPDGAWTGAISVTIDRDAASVAAALDDTAGRFAAVQPVLPGRARLHVAVADGGDAVATCLWAEDVRRRLEIPLLAAAE